MDSTQTELAACRELEQAERSAAASSADDSDRDEHVMRAERHADLAWRIEEESDLDYRPSGLWDR